MNRYIASLILLVSLFSSNSQAGPFTDKLSICLVENTSIADKRVLIKWVFGAMASHPDVQKFSSIPESSTLQTNKKTAALFMDLLTIRCGQEAKEATKYEGDSAIEASFGVLGEVAMSELTGHPNVTQYMMGFTQYLNEKRLSKIYQ